MIFANERKHFKIVILRVLDSYDLSLTDPRDRAAPLYTVQINLKLIFYRSPIRHSSECLPLPARLAPILFEIGVPAVVGSCGK